MMPPGAFAIIRDEHGRYLLVRDRNRNDKPASEQKWGLPGGRIESDESPEETCRREGLEETGLELEVSRRIGQFFLVKKPGIVYLCECRVIGGKLAQETTETSAAKFFGLHELPQAMYPAQTKLILWSLVSTNGKPYCQPLLFPRPEQLAGYDIAHLLVTGEA